MKQQVMSMYTDPNRIHATDPGKVEGNPVFVYHDAFNQNQTEVAELKERYAKGTVGDVEIKEKLFRVLNERLAPIRERRLELEKDTAELDNILKSGTAKVRVEASETLKYVKEKMKLYPF